MVLEKPWWTYIDNPDQIVQVLMSPMGGMKHVLKYYQYLDCQAIDFITDQKKII